MVWLQNSFLTAENMIFTVSLNILKVEKHFQFQHLGCFKTNLNKTGIHWTPHNKRYFFDRTH